MIVSLLISGATKIFLLFFLEFGEFPDEWQRYGNAVAILSVFSGLHQAPELSVPPAEYHAEDQLPQVRGLKLKR